MAETNDAEKPITRRQWMVRQVILNGTAPALAQEAVASVAIEHPEWDMDEEKTMQEWEGAIQ